MYMEYSAQQIKDRHQRAEENGLREARANALTAQQIIEINGKARQAVIQAAVKEGKPLSDSVIDAASKAGQLAVEAARLEAVPGNVTNAAAAK